jgi:succinate dehydrogenase/fumarate reductase-like Fe-S protein
MSIETPNLISLKVFRGDTQNHELVSYKIPFEPGQSVLNALHYIADHHDPGLTFSCSCRIGICSSCMVKVNSKTVFSCTTLVEDGMVIEPYKEGGLVRDLVAELPSIAPHKEKKNNRKSI